jgi:hypothetical protein
MKKLQFSIDVAAPKEKVWKTLWEDSSYRKWTSVFSEGSHAITDWKEGSKVWFLDGKRDGMVSNIARKIPNELMSFRHVGVVKDGREKEADEETKKWSGAMETYELQQVGDMTRVQVEIDVADEHMDMFRDVFPRALEKVKEISEKSKTTTEVV